jgi:cell wall-associated NlpC family hydrolase
LGHPQLDDRVNKGQSRQPYNAAPRGTLVFYNTSAQGHVAISLGNGQIASTGVGGRIAIASISYQPRPLGWAYSPWGTPW